MIVDANILLYAADETSPVHAAARGWLEEALNGSRRVGLPWVSLTAFVRIATHPRATDRPLQPGGAWQIVEEWLDAPAAWVPEPGPGFRQILGGLVRNMHLRGNLVSDAVLAALAIEFGMAIVSADSDFARFNEVEWVNPVGEA